MDVTIQFERKMAILELQCLEGRSSLATKFLGARNYTKTTRASALFASLLVASLGIFGSCFVDTAGTPCTSNSVTQKFLIQTSFDNHI